MQFLLLTIYTPTPWLISLSLYFLSICNASLFLHIASIFFWPHFSLYHRLPLLPRPFILLPCLMLSSAFPFFYLVLFLSKPFFYAHDIIRFFSRSKIALFCSLSLLSISFRRGYLLASMEGFGWGGLSVSNLFVSAGTDFCSAFICSIIDFLTATVFFCYDCSALFCISVSWRRLTENGIFFFSCWVAEPFCPPGLWRKYACKIQYLPCPAFD